MIINCCHLQVIQDIQSQLDRFTITEKNNFDSIFFVQNTDLARLLNFLKRKDTQKNQKPSLVTSIFQDSEFLFNVLWFDNFQNKK